MRDTKSRVIDICRRRVRQGMPTAMSEAIVRLLRPSVRLLPQAAGELLLGGSRIGGLPDLPEGAAWPSYPGPAKPDAAWEAFKGEPLSFLLQVNLAEVAPFDLENQLPASGLLHFFYLDAVTRFGLYPTGGEVIHVIYTPEVGARLHRLAAPQDMPPEEMYRGFALTPGLEWTVPSWGDVKMVLEKPDIDVGIHHWDDLKEEVAETQNLGARGAPKHRLLGNGDFIQTNECVSGSTKLLLQVDSDCWMDDAPYPRTGMMWGDAGRVYYYIDSHDLQTRNFGAVFGDFENH